MKKRDFETYQKRFRDFEILPKFSETHVFRGTIRHPFWSCFGQESLVGEKIMNEWAPVSTFKFSRHVTSIHFLNPIAPELPVTTSTDPHPFYP